MRDSYFRARNWFSTKFLLAGISIVLLFLFQKDSVAQLVVNTNVTAQQIVEKLLGCGSAASNITLSSCGTAVGFFNGVNTNLGIDSGVIFSTGDVTLANGPNTTEYQGSDNGCPGNTMLSALCGQQTFNAIVLDFDVTLNTDTLRFNYVFGSEEYAEWVGTIYNDVFALWISGPGIVGNQDLATIPGTPYPISIGNVNCTIGNGTYYRCNDPANTICSSAYNCPTNPNQTTLQYDGLTTVLTAKHAVQYGQTYHLEFAIADAGDGIYDSGIFFQADFLQQYSLSILSDSSNFINPFDTATVSSPTPTIVEGCQQGIFHFNLASSHADTLFVPIIVGGTATNGADYSFLNDTLVFLPGDTTKTVTLDAFADGIPEGTESVIIYQLDACSGLPVDSFIINIIDSLPFAVSNDTTICEKTFANLVATFSPYYSYQWQPSALVACATCNSTIGLSQNTTMYSVGVGLGTCIYYDSINVTVDVITPGAGADQYLCHGDTTQLFAQGGTAYAWSPATGLSTPNSASTLAFPDVTTDYIVQVTGTYALCHDFDTVRITVVPNLIGLAGNDTSVCPGSPVQLWASGGDFYSWTPSLNVDDTSSAAPTVSPFITTTYKVVVSNIYSCTDTQEVLVNVFPDPTITMNQPYTIFIGESAQLFVHAGVGSAYEWTPTDYLSDRNIYNPVATPDSSITYMVRITTEGGCIYYDTTIVKVVYETLVMFPNAFTPNHDGMNDKFGYVVRGPFDLKAFQIFDRWGNTIFSSSVLNEGWDGKVSGKDEELGTYVYVLTGRDGNGKEVNKKGAFLLLR